MNLEEIKEKLKSKITFENKLIFIVSFIAGLPTHFYFYTHECLSPDAVWAGDIHVSGLWEVTLGRWGIQIIDLLRGGLVSRFLITVFCIFALSITTMLIVKMLKIKKYIIIALTAVLMVVIPQVAETFMFIYCADSYCLAMLFSVLAVYFIYERKSIKHYIFSGLFVIISLSLYQSYIGVTVALCMILPIIKLLDREDKKEVLKDILKSIIIVAIVMLIYYGITRIILYILNASLASYGGANNIGISTIKYLIPETVNAYKTFLKYFFGESFIYNNFWHRDIINLILFIFTATNIIYIIIKNKIYKDKLSLLLAFAILIMLPIGVNIINIIAPERENNLVIGMSYVISYVFILKIADNLKNNKIADILRRATITCIGILLVTFVLSNNASYMARQKVYEHYYSTSMRILNKIENFEGYNKNTQVLIGGIIKYKPAIAKMGNGFISNDYETWKNYNGTRMINNFYKNYMGTTIRLCNYKDYLKIVESEEYKKMSLFPYDGSVKMIDGILVVKLEENPVKE